METIDEFNTEMDNYKKVVEENTKGNAHLRDPYKLLKMVYAAPTPKIAASLIVDFANSKVDYIMQKQKNKKNDRRGKQKKRRKRD